MPIITDRQKRLEESLRSLGTSLKTKVPEYTEKQVGDVTVRNYSPELSYEQMLRNKAVDLLTELGVEYTKPESAVTGMMGAGVAIKQGVLPHAARVIEKVERKLGTPVSVARNTAEMAKEAATLVEEAIGGKFGKIVAPVEKITPKVRKIGEAWFFPGTKPKIDLMTLSRKPSETITALAHEVAHASTSEGTVVEATGKRFATITKAFTSVLSPELTGELKTVSRTLLPRASARGTLFAELFGDLVERAVARKMLVNRGVRTAALPLKDFAHSSSGYVEKLPKKLRQKLLAEAESFMSKLFPYEETAKGIGGYKKLFGKIIETTEEQY